MASLVRLLAVLFAIPASAISVGSMEVGPNVEILLDSGERVTFATWVNVTNERQFEAVWRIDFPPADPGALKVILREASDDLSSVARDHDADSMLISALWEIDGTAGAATCDFERLSEPPRCFTSP